MENPKVRSQQVLINSTDHYCFAVSKTAATHDFAWLAEQFGEYFYKCWKDLKRRHVTQVSSGGKGELESLLSFVTSVVFSFNQQNPYGKLRFVELRGAFDIFHDQFGLGTVMRRGQLSDELLGEAVVLKGTNRLCEYVRDSYGTMLKRFVYRAVGDDPKAALGYTKAGMYASGTQSATVKQGKVTYKSEKKATRAISEHVIGKKPSVFLSFTTLRKGATNPQGDAFGKVKVKIDLQVLKDHGVTFVYMGSQEGERLLQKELKNPTGAVLQAFEDVVRTREVLIEGFVPAEALCAIYDEDDIVWSR